MLKNIRIVLMATSHPGNVGATARAMKTMGLSELVLVAPQDYPSEKAIAMAAHAEDILQQAKVVGTLDQALEGCELIFGTSARSRYLDWPLLTPREAAKQAIEYSTHRSHSVAILFGRERTGLENEELQRCHAHIHIPANPDYSSLNLAASVQIIAYELRLAFLATEPNALVPETLADDAAMQALHEHLAVALRSIDFINAKAPKQVMGRLKRLLQRARCETEEVNLLRGLCSKMERVTTKRSSPNVLVGDPGNKTQ